MNPQIEIKKSLQLDDEKLLLGAIEQKSNKSFINYFFNIFRKKNTRKVLLEQHMDQFLHFDNKELIFELLKNGYILTSKQYKSFENLLLKLIEESKLDSFVYSIIEKTLSCNIELSHELSFSIFKRFLGITKSISTQEKLEPTYKTLIDIPLILKSDYIIKVETWNHNYELPLLTDFMKKYIQSGVGFKEELNQLLESIENLISQGSATQSYLAQKYLLHFKFLIAEKYKDYFLPYIDYTKLNKIAKKIEKNRYCKEELKLEMKHFLSILLTINFKDNKEILKIETKQEFKQNYIKNHPTHKIIQNNIVTKQLPIEAINLLKKIESIYFNITEEFKNLDFECKNLFENKIPQLVQEYLNIDEKLRQSLKHISNKNADDFLIESLNNIHSYMFKKWNDINEEKLIALSTTTKYTSNFKIT